MNTQEARELDMMLATKINWLLSQGEVGGHIRFSSNLAQYFAVGYGQKVESGGIDFLDDESLNIAVNSLSQHSMLCDADRKDV